MILHAFFEAEDDQNDEPDSMMTLRETHDQPFSAVAQLVIMDQSPETKEKALRTGLFTDYRHSDRKKELELTAKKIELRIEVEKLTTSYNHEIGKDEQDDEDQEQIIEEQDHSLTYIDQLQILASSLQKNIILHSDRKSRPVVLAQNGQASYNTNVDFNLKTDKDGLYVMIKYKNRQKLIDQEKLSLITQKYPILEESIPLWLKKFQNYNLDDYFRKISSNQDCLEVKERIKILQEIAVAQIAL